jgi:DNA-binding NtrC family response regulator
MWYVDCKLSLDASRKVVVVTSAVAAAQRRTNSMNLLVLAKEQHVRTSCSIAAAFNGMNVTAVATAQKAITILDTSNVDILIADLKLCESDDLNLIKRLQATQPELAIIGLTGYGTIDSAGIATLLAILHFLARASRQQIYIPDSIKTSFPTSLNLPKG